MRDRHCLQCGILITHFGKGYKYSIFKRNGGYYHEECYIKHMNTPRKVSHEKRKIHNRKYYLNNIETLREKYRRRYHELKGRPKEDG